MALPIKFSNVHYYLITGQYNFGGDLVIAKGFLYFFPRVDLETERQRRTNYAYRFAGLLGVLLVKVVYLVVDSAQQSILTEKGLWQDGISDEQFRQGADAYIAKLKEQPKLQSFSESLPTPTRVAAAEISGLKLGATGKLSFFAQSDKQDFNVGILKKKSLREALWESDCGKV